MMSDTKMKKQDEYLHLIISGILLFLASPILLPMAGIYIAYASIKGRSDDEIRDRIEGCIDRFDDIDFCSLDTFSTHSKRTGFTPALFQNDSQRGEAERAKTDFLSPALRRPS